jgi:multidrug efflux pump subunit AcrB
MDQPEHNFDQTLNWFSRAASTVLSVALVYPVTTALTSLATIALVVALVIVPPILPKKTPEPSSSRLQQMMQAVQNADARVRQQHADRIQQDTEFRGIWDTFRDKDQPAASASERTTEPSP